MMQSQRNHFLENADIERELYQLGISDTLPNQPPTYPQIQNQFLNWFTSQIPQTIITNPQRKTPVYTRSNSAPASHPREYYSTMGSPNRPWDANIPTTASHRSLTNIPLAHSLTPTSIRKHSVNMQEIPSQLLQLQQQIKSSPIPGQHIETLESAKEEPFLIHRAHTIPGPSQMYSNPRLFRQTSIRDPNSPLAKFSLSQLEQLRAAAQAGYTHLTVPISPHSLSKHSSPGSSLSRLSAAVQSQDLSQYDSQLINPQLRTYASSSDIQENPLYDNIGPDGYPIDPRYGHSLEYQRLQQSIPPQMQPLSPSRYKGNFNFNVTNPHISPLIRLQANQQSLQVPQTHISGIHQQLRALLQQNPRETNIHSNEIPLTPRQLTPKVAAPSIIYQPQVDTAIVQGDSGAYTRSHMAPNTWGGDAGEVHYPGHVQSQDFVSLPRGAQSAEGDFSNVLAEAAAIAAERQLVASVEAALRRVHAGLQESHIMYEQPDSELDPPPPQPINQTLRDPPPSPEPAHNGHPPPSGPPYDPESYPPDDEDPDKSGEPRPSSRIVGPSNASQLSRKLGFIPIQDSQDEKESDQSSHRRTHAHKKKSKAYRKDILGITRGTGIKVVHIRRDPEYHKGFGFSIKGGRDCGVGVYVSRVENDGPAWEAGLRPGDLLLANDNTCFSQLTHVQAITLLKSSEELTLTVAATSQVAASVVVSQTYSWVCPDGRPTTPPPEYNPRLHQHQVTTVSVDLGGAESLGLMIRGGVEYGLGIFITGVDQGSAANKAGLQVGDQILEVNGESFLAVTHDTAVNVLKYSRLLRMALRRVAKLPHSCTTYDRRPWTQSEAESSVENLEATLAMIEEKSLSVLSHSEHATLREVVSDYAAGRVAVTKLLAVACTLLNHPDKVGLLTELREVVRIEDQNKFDAAVFPQSVRPPSLQTDLYGSQTMGTSEAFLCDGVDVPLIYGEAIDPARVEDGLIEGITRGLRQINKTPSEDSGVELGITPGLLGRREPSNLRQRVERAKRTETRLITTNSTTEGDGWIGDEYGYHDDEFTALVKEHDERGSIKSRLKVLQAQNAERMLSSDNHSEFQVHKPQLPKLLKK